jgi:hypothetical protein
MMQTGITNELGLFVDMHNKKTPVRRKIANEEMEDGPVLAIDTVNGTIYELPWLGLFSHENTIHAPYFYGNGNIEQNHVKQKN